MSSFVDDGPRPRSDREVWERLRTGSESAFAEIFARHSDAVYNFAFRRTACWATAEDITQATFVTLWRRALAGRTDVLRHDSARAVLLAMAGHESANTLRGLRRLTALKRKVSVEETADDHADRVAADIDSERQMRRVRELVDRLPASQREVVELVWWSGCSMQEAADALSVPVGTVKSRLSRARARLGEHTVTVGREELA